MACAHFNDDCLHSCRQEKKLKEKNNKLKKVEVQKEEAEKQNAKDNCSGSGKVFAFASNAMLWGGSLCTALHGIFKVFCIPHCT